jgi:Tfp pilus assembly protein PilF
MENKLVPIRALLGELYLAAGMNEEALLELEAAVKSMPNRYRMIAGAATAARATRMVDVAKRHYLALTALAAAGEAQRPELAEAKSYLSQN